MKRLIISVFAVVVALNAVPAFASGQAESKNDCLVYGKNCPNVADSLPERIQRLENEIAKGERVYTAQELKFLEQQLEENAETMRVLLRGGGS